MDRYKVNNVDKEEKELMDALDKMDVKSINAPSLKEQKIFKNAAKNFIKKETKMNIRIAPSQLAKIKERADKEGLKYSTLVKSVMHKYLTGQLIEKTK